MSTDQDESSMKGLRATTFKLGDTTNKTSVKPTYVRAKNSFIVRAYDNSSERQDPDDTDMPSSNHIPGRFLSFDLVEHTFGPTVPITLASLVLLVLLKHNVVQVYSRSADIPSPTSTEEQIDACIDAVNALLGVLYHKQPHHYGGGTYRWEWSPRLDTKTRAGAANFLNTFAIIAHRVVSIILAPQTMGIRPLRSLWTIPPVPISTSPSSSDASNASSRASDASSRASDASSRASDAYSSRASDAPLVDEVNTLPDIAALPIAAFTVSYGLSDPRDDINQHPSVYSTIQSIFNDPPSLSSSATGSGSFSSTTSTSSFLESNLGININGLKTFFRIHLPKLSLTAQDFSNFRQNDVKDIYMCLEAFAATGRVVEMEPFLAIEQEMRYMEKQRRAQPHLRYVLGVAVTGDKMSICRADAVGIEECNFPLDSGSGMLEAIRVALGFAIADNETLGHLPGFEF